MKKFLIIILFINMNCSTNFSGNYKGYIYNVKQKSLYNVKVYEERDSTNYTYSNKNGYFLLKAKSLNFIDNLIFEKEGYITDTVYPYSVNRRGTKTYFITKKIDTLFMKKYK